MPQDETSGLLGLRRHLAPVIDGGDSEGAGVGESGAVQPAFEFDGPRSWWGGALDVEGLALGSVGALLEGLAAVDRSRKAGHRATTSAALVAASFDSIRLLRVAGAAPDVWAPMSGFRPTRDGWVRLHANYPHHAERLAAALGLSSPPQSTAPHLSAALLERTALEVESAVRAAGGVAAAVRTREEWLASPMGQAAEAEPWIRFALGDAGPGRRNPEGRPGDLPLEGVRILDFTRVIAGPSATRLLGALGADVLRVDPPQLPELLDQHIDTGFGKRSALADLRDPEQLARVRELARTADAVFIGYRESSLARHGLDAASLRADFPHLAVVALNAWGWEGPWAEGRGFDSIVQAACGIADLYGQAAGLAGTADQAASLGSAGMPGSADDGGARRGAARPDTWRPGALPVQALDHATGMGMAAAALALLAGRPRGIGGSARLSLIATANELLRAAPPPEAGAPAQPAELPVSVRTAQSPYGELSFVPPLLRLDGRQLEYPHPPELYGSSPLEWVGAR